jgi:hypothetical protein
MVDGRGEPRHETKIIGRVRMAAAARDVTILDLSENGCRFHDRFSTLALEAPVSIKLGPVGPLAAKVKWRRGEYVGIEFDLPLYPAVLDHIRAHFDTGEGR